MPTRKPVCSVQEIAFGAISATEIDIALYYVDNTYTVPMDMDLFRLVFNTVQKRREEGVDLHDLACVVVDELVLESAMKRDAFLGGVMKVYNHRGIMVRKRAKTKGSARTGTKRGRKKHPFDSKHTAQRLLFPPREKV
jgi:hypothetical protein